ncbi:hypothetical protein CCACVL1_31001, partial [Corchorus capsularis]
FGTPVRVKMPKNGLVGYIIIAVGN